MGKAIGLVLAFMARDVRFTVCSSKQVWRGNPSLRLQREIAVYGVRAARLVGLKGGIHPDSPTGDPLTGGVPPQEAAGTHRNRVRPFACEAPYCPPTLTGYGNGRIRTIGRALLWRQWDD